MTEFCNVRVTAELCAKAEQRFGMHFDSISDLLTCLLEELLRDDIGHFQQAEQKIVEERLRDLGYI